MTIKQISDVCEVSQDTLRYYERVGMIPPVKRTAGGIRDYTQEDIRWVELAKCMRSAGLPVESLVEYVRLFRQGNETIGQRLELLRNQHRKLQEQRSCIDITLERLELKISRYEQAERTGKLDWGKGDNK